MRWEQLSPDPAPFPALSLGPLGLGASGSSEDGLATGSQDPAAFRTAPGFSALRTGWDDTSHSRLPQGHPQLPEEAAPALARTRAKVTAAGVSAALRSALHPPSSFLNSEALTPLPSRPGAAPRKAPGEPPELLGSRGLPCHRPPHAHPTRSGQSSL